MTHHQTEPSLTAAELKRVSQAFQKANEGKDLELWQWISLALATGFEIGFEVGTKTKGPTE